jgi:hypothetical protein
MRSELRADEDGTSWAFMHFYERELRAAPINVLNGYLAFLQ